MPVLALVLALIIGFCPRASYADGDKQSLLCERLLTAATQVRVEDILVAQVFSRPFSFQFKFEIKPQAEQRMYPIGSLNGRELDGVVLSLEAANHQLDQVHVEMRRFESGSLWPISSPAIGEKGQPVVWQYMLLDPEEINIDHHTLKATRPLRPQFELDEAWVGFVTESDEKGVREFLSVTSLEGDQVVITLGLDVPCDQAETYAIEAASDLLHLRTKQGDLCRVPILSFARSLLVSLD